MDLGWMRPLGRAMRGLRAGAHGLASNSGWLAGVPEAIHVTSPAFGAGRDIPASCTTDGPGLSPALGWTGLPGGTVSVALLIEDPDIPLPVPLNHGIVYGLPPALPGLDEGAVPHAMTGTSELGFRTGRNSFGRTGWLPITPPPGHGPHHYAFQVFALDNAPRFDWPPGRHALLRTIRGHVLAWGVLFGVYERP